ncbi:hypothetical protein BJ684DRAFT_16607 [Piptocephalis cylindrospora]|uniref:Uncharacterized protein n=1 Tax=Piptocephalis cylindrospora TaxID=1907219 RepID=A0A4P9Y490_9FUNG|nr:hypothetical protein BJ684DRAFT_16607 [Piptocephalis cylindrospora]|eukprot:RKP12951.1 hypothetical protein BJ684DRAFT_16607 [Piptocephalis cylindrospora]
MSTVQNIYTPTASSIPDHARHGVREELHLEHAVDTTRFNAPVDMIRPPIGMTDGLFGGRDNRSSRARCSASPRGETQCVHTGSYPQSPPPGPANAHFSTLHSDSDVEPHDHHRLQCRSTSHSQMSRMSRCSESPSPPPPGTVSLDDSRWSRDIVPDRMAQKPSGVRVIQYDEMRRRAFLDPTMSCRSIKGTSLTFDHSPATQYTSHFQSFGRTLSFPRSSQGLRSSHTVRPDHTPYAPQDTLPGPPRRRRDDFHDLSQTSIPEAAPRVECDVPLHRTVAGNVRTADHRSLRDRLFGWMG